ncbi:MAG: signal peptidase II [Lachnospiraceae bacterium]|jgi:signal peptidase II|nr:signal peptidase II [Lachnospiraceae bacterium]MCI1726482.1 signal peptidase II [Lachnospiraceae bacterium]
MIYLLIAAAVFFLDFFLKRYMEDHLEENGEPKEELGGKVYLQRMKNSGSAGGFFHEDSKKVKMVTTAAFGVTALSFLIVLFQKGKHLTKLALALLTGGGAGNMTDRWTHGYVTDFLRIRTGIGKIGRLVFNAADLFIFLGSILAVISSLLPGGKSGREK